MQRCRRSFTALTVVAMMVLTCAGCTTAPVLVNFGPSDVDHIELYEYTYLSSGTPIEATLTMVTTRGEVEHYVTSLTDRKTKSLAMVPTDVDRWHAMGLRFHLRDGSTVEVTEIWQFGSSVVVWSNGTAQQTRHASGPRDGPRDSRQVPIEQAPEVPSWHVD